MKIIDLLKTSQKNLVRSKLRTFLTILAVIIGTFTISLTNGVGNGVKAYINKELGNVGVNNAFVVQARAPSEGPVGSDVVEYDPKTTKGSFGNLLLTDKDLANIQQIRNVASVIPAYTMQIDYISTGSAKYVASASQYTQGLNLAMAAGRVVDSNQADEVSLPIRYLSYLGFANANDAIGKKLILGYKNSQAQEVEKSLTIVGVQEESLLGNSSVYITSAEAQAVSADQNAGNANLANAYPMALVEFDENLPQAQIDELKSTLEANNYTADTIQDQIGMFSKVINGIIIGLDIFGVITLLVAGFGIVNTLFMAVNERTSEIGLMKALGANSKTVFAIFSLEAASIGFWGAIIGIALSVGAGKIANRYASSHFLKDFAGFHLLAFPIPNSILILAGIVVLAFFAGALPSVKASRLDPIKALRYE
ncbi:MAG TPA: FtsX-like permease family protein [Patescibacteria group bacterium]|nr:FtsX-like permease family protein [Patescibacteria group bacterium]